MSDVFSEAEARYEEAKARRDALREAWADEGQPLLAYGSAGQLVEHPLLRSLRDHDLLLLRLGRDLQARHRGPKPSAVISISQSPASRRRSIR